MDLAGISGAGTDAEFRDRAEKEAERLAEEIKKEVQTRVEEIGTLRKRLSVTLPAKVIDEHLKHNFDELRQDAIVPGFRKGRAPLQLIQKRFGPEVRNSLKTSILAQSLLAAMEKEKLEVLGDPLFEVQTDRVVKLVNLDEALSHIELPESHDLSYVCEVEVKPTFELPPLEGIEIRTPAITLTDADVDEYILRQRKIRGRYEPLLDQPAAEPDDLLVADVTLRVGPDTVKTEDNVQLGVRPTRLDGIPLPKLGEVLRGARPGDRRTCECQIPDDYERPDLRGQVGEFEFHIHEVKRLVPMPLDAFVSQVGADSVEQLREFVREEREAERDRMVERAKRGQVIEYLLKNTALDLPATLSNRQTDRAVIRRVIDLQQQGVPDSEIEAHIDELRVSAREQAARDLRVEFILDKVAEKLGVEVTDEEVNSEIARIARLYHRRFDRVRDDLHKRGLLSQLAEQIRQDKCVSLLLEAARFVQEDAPPAQ
jgi:trigger factor